MKTYRFFLLCFSAAVAFPSTARAEWEHRADIVTSFDVLGYRPTKILSNDGDAVYQSTVENKARGEVRGRFRIVGTYLHFELEPYTVVSGRALMVTLAGIEARAYVPMSFLTDRLRLGYYHHSSHNFNDGSLGGGLVLDGLMVDVTPWKDTFETGGQKGDLGLRINATGFINRRAPPYLVTESATVAAGDTGETLWRLTADLQVRHPTFRVDAGLQVVSPQYVPTSLLFRGAATFKLAPEFLGELGQHLYVGPFLAIGGNFSRASEFGGSGFVGGIRLDIVVSEFVPGLSL